MAHGLLNAMVPNNHPSLRQLASVLLRQVIDSARSYWVRVSPEVRLDLGPSSPRPGTVAPE